MTDEEAYRACLARDDWAAKSVRRSVSYLLATVKMHLDPPRLPGGDGLRYVATAAGEARRAIATAVDLMRLESEEAGYITVKAWQHVIDQVSAIPEPTLTEADEIHDEICRLESRAEDLRRQLADTDPPLVKLGQGDYIREITAEDLERRR